MQQRRVPKARTPLGLLRTAEVRVVAAGAVRLLRQPTAMECDAMFRMKTWVAMATVAIVLEQAGSAVAGYVTGAELRDTCRPQTVDPVYRLKVAECRGYVLGIADSFDCARPLRQPAWNSQSAVSQEDLVNTVLVWLDRHPQSLAFQADGLVAAALSEAFPCP